MISNIPTNFKIKQIFETSNKYIYSYDKIFYNLLKN